MRLPMEFTSNLFMKTGELPCASMVHCEYHGIPWMFDFSIMTETSWEEFGSVDFSRKKTWKGLARAFRTKLERLDILPQSIEQYLSVAGPRVNWLLCLVGELLF
jgi:hypothetical protein